MDFSVISEARRVYRQCRYLESFYAGVHALDMSNILLRYLTAGRYFSLVCHYTFDQIVFLREHGMFEKSINKEKLIRLKKITSAAWWLRFVIDYRVD